MKEVDLQRAPAKDADDVEPEGPRWWERVLWSIGSGLVALVVAYLQAGLVLGAAMFYERPHLFDEFGLATAVFFAAIAAGFVGLVTGAIYPGRLGVGKMIVAHCIFLAILSVWIFPSGGGYAMHTPFLLLAALLEGAIASAVIRAAANAPLPVRATNHVVQADAPREKPPLGEMPWLKDDLASDAEHSPRWWERVVWSIGCGLGGFGLGCLLGTLYWGFPWRPAVGFDDNILIFIQFVGSVVIGGVGLVAGAIWPGRIAAAILLFAHAAGALKMAILLISPIDTSVYFSHYLATAIVLGVVAFIILRAWPEDKRQS